MKRQIDIIPKPKHGKFHLHGLGRAAMNINQARATKFTKFEPTALGLGSRSVILSLTGSDVDEIVGWFSVLIF